MFINFFLLFVYIYLSICTTFLVASSYFNIHIFIGIYFVLCFSCLHFCFSQQAACTGTISIILVFFSFHFIWFHFISFHRKSFNALGDLQDWRSGKLTTWLAAFWLSAVFAINFGFGAKKNISHKRYNKKNFENETKRGKPEMPQAPERCHRNLSKSKSKSRAKRRTVSTKHTYDSETNKSKQNAAASNESVS